jgi:hypothetical protein
VFKKLLFSLVPLLVLLAPLSTAEAASTETCTGGTIAAGSHPALTVTGSCSLPASGTVTVQGSLTVAGNLDVKKAGVLNALSPATLNVLGNVSVGNNAIAVIGCSPAAGCSVTTTDHINGNVSASGARALIIHSAIIGGNVSVQGGGGGVNCAINPTLEAIVGFPSPLFTDFEDNHIAGNVTMSNLQTCWSGFIRNQVGGSGSFTNNAAADPDANEYVTNRFGGNLACSGNSPAAQFGDTGGQPNVVGGHKTEECVKL